MVTYNLKQDLPTVEVARRRLEDRLQTLNREGAAVVKVVHGYGSTGVGGKIKHGLTPTFRRLEEGGIIRGFLPGERWARSDPAARQLLNDYPDLASDPDLGRNNRGITLVVLRGKRGGRKQARPAPVVEQPRPAAAETEDLERQLETDPDRVYDKYSQPHVIRRLKPEP